MHAVTLGQGVPGPRWPCAYVPLIPSLKGKNQPLYAGSSSFSRTIENQGRAASASENVSRWCIRELKHQWLSLAEQVVTRHLLRYSGTPLRLAAVREVTAGVSQRSGPGVTRTIKQPLSAQAVVGTDLQTCVVGSIAFTCFACSRSIPSQSIGFCCAQIARPFDQSIETTPATDIESTTDASTECQCCSGPPMRSVAYPTWPGKKGPSSHCRCTAG